MKILGTGLSGMVGSRVVELLNSKYEFENLSLETGVDITNRQTVFDKVEKSSAEWVFHFAARTDVDLAEDELNNQNGSYWKTNVEATNYFVEACLKYNKKLLYISTDYVFDGESDSYDENSKTNPLGWYGQTKYEGEKLILKLGKNGLIIRIANPYCQNPTFKLDFIHKIADVLKKGNNIKAPNDQIFVPTFIDDIAKAIDFCLENKLSGICHSVGGKNITPYEVSLMIAKKLNISSSKVDQIAFKDYFIGRAKRPQKANLINNTLNSSHFKMSTFEEGLAIINF